MTGEAAGAIGDEGRCPCLSGETYGACCGRYHRAQAAAATAELLMRSRYSAFAIGDARYLLETWHPRTRPDRVGLDEDTRWMRLDILGTVGGGMLDTVGEVEFRAVFRGAAGAARGSMHERSRFVRAGGRWYYVDGDRLP